MFLKVLVLASAIGISLQDATMEEPVVITLTTSGNFSTVHAFSHNPVQPFSLPSLFTPSVQTCRSWQCPRQRLDLIQTDGELIMAAPFEGGVCLTNLQAIESATFSGNSSATLLHLNSFLADSSTRCTLLNLANVSNSYIAYCLQVTILYSCSLHVNVTELSESYFKCERVTSFSSSPDPLSIATSNFVLGDNFVVFFTHGGLLFRTSYKSGGARAFPLSGPQSCHRAVYWSETLYLYCDNNSVVLTDTSGSVIDTRTLNGTGVPFPCKGTHNSFTVRQYQNHTEIAYNGGPAVYSNGPSFYDAACIMDSSGTPLFVFIDREEGLFVVNGSSMILEHHPEACNGTNTCNGLFVNSGPYVVVLSGGGATTLQQMTVYGGNHLELLRQENLVNEVSRVGIYTIIRPVTKATVNTPTDETAMDSEFVSTELTTSLPKKHQRAIIAGSVVGVVIIIAVAVVVTLLALYLFKKSFLQRVCCDLKKYWHKPTSSSSPTSKRRISQPQTSKDGGSPHEQVMPGTKIPGGSRAGSGTAGNDTGMASSGTPASSPVSKLQELKSDDAKFGYESTVPIKPQQPTN